MEKSFTTKRKKRKTRKCLDEMRNRSRRMGKHEESIAQKRDKVIKTNTSNNCLITMNRLTLAMFHNAVKSETITRPQLADLKQKANISVRDVVHGTSVKSSAGSSNVTDINYIDQSHDVEINAASDYEKISQGSIHETSKYGSENSCEIDGSKTPTSLALFSTVTKLSTSIKRPKSNTSTSISSGSSQVINESGDFYGDLMEEVQMNFKRLTAKMVHEDVIWKTKERLHKLYLESCQQEYENNIMKCIRSNKMSNYLESPDTQRTNTRICTATDEKLDFFKEYSVSLSESPECAFSGPTRTSDSETRLSTCSPCIIFSPKESNSDSPEYIFYPHQLNN